MQFEHVDGELTVGEILRLKIHNKWNFLVHTMLTTDQAESYYSGIIVSMILNLSGCVRSCMESLNLGTLPVGTICLSACLFKLLTF